MHHNYSIWLISQNAHDLNFATSKLQHNNVNWFNGENYPSFSKLVNDCVHTSPTEITIILCNKVAPTDANIQLVIDKLNQGFAFVGLFDFRFFGIKKQLFRQIGPLDENFPGGFEDDDFIIRLIANNLACYITMEAHHVWGPSTWAPDGRYPGIDYFYQKYMFWPSREQPQELYQRLRDSYSERDWGPPQPCDFLSCKEHSYVQTGLAKYWYLNKIGRVGNFI